MAMGNKRRLEILLILSIVANFSFVVIQIFSSDKEKRLKSNIEILRTLEGYSKEGKGFRHNLLLDESFQINSQTFKKDGRPATQSAATVDSTTQRSNNIRAVPTKLLRPKDERLEDGPKIDRKPTRSKVNITMKEYCPEGGDKLEGLKKINVKQLVDSVHLVDTLSVENGGLVEFGGWWEPKHCKPRTKVAIMLPYRNREVQLQSFLLHMHPIFQRQLISYRVFVIEQVGVTSWNKGSIYNIGFDKTRKIDDYDCYIFHDIDLLAENDKNYYGCPFTPAHMSVAVDTLKYKLPYPTIFGGVEAFSTEEYIAINGFSNMYWGWGGEDDDLYTRVAHKGYKLYRPPQAVGRYTMNQVNHFRSDGRTVANQKMYHDSKTRKQRIDLDGLNRIQSLQYTYKVMEEPLFTRIAIDLKRSRELKI
ncbi:beta-1,4-galactosyltransferase 6-like [Rhopilema esculentum]|uniref:beta-1,4-galactosyltransferase 6-like n=1 Tax=Rhopilema esculentum TaxID=499914 RepID=UPI0031D1456B